MQTLFEALFNRFLASTIRQWKCDEAGHFTLRLQRSIRIWVPASNEKLVTGGVVMQFEETINGRFSPEQNAMHLMAGIIHACYVQHLWTQAVSPPLKTITLKGEEVEFKVKTGWKHTTSVNPFTHLLREWRDESELVTGDVWAFLDNKRQALLGP